MMADDLIPTREDQTERVDALRQGGVEYVIINFGSSCGNIQRFARDIMPAFADEPAFALTGK